MASNASASTLLYKLDRYNFRAHMVLEAEVKLKKWGSSIGLVLPKKAVEKEGFKIGEIVRVHVFKKKNPWLESFGTMKFSKSTDEILKEVDKEGWDE